MKPIGKKVLVKQDEEIIENVTVTAGGLILSVSNDKLAEQVIRDAKEQAHVTGDAVDAFNSKVGAETKVEKVVKKLNTGVILSVGAELENHPDFSVGDRVEFSSFVNKKNELGEEVLLINVDSLLANLSR